MAERLIAPVLKTGVPARGPRVRIPPSPPIQYTYDGLGRPLTRVELEGTTTWTWGQASDNTPTAKYIGRLKSISTSSGYGEINTYDSLGRIAQQSVIIDAVPYQINRTYSATTGWPATLQYPTSTSGYRLQLAYDYQNGYLKRVRNASSGTVYWEAVSADAAGRLQNETFGNGVQTYTEYDQANGWLFKRQAGVGGGTGLIDAQVSWDYNGNFTTRQHLKQGLTETFVYDAMNRLDYSQRNGVTNLDVTLDAIGNVTWKSDVGSYSYHATKRRAVVAAGSNSYGYDANGNMVTRNGSTISYASYNLPTSIASGANSSTLTYGAWRNRIKQVAVSSGSTETTVYVGGLLEKVTKGSTVEYRHQIEATPGTVAVYVRKSSASNIMYYLHRDHLGSPEMITNSSGTSLVKLSFSAYGERRDVDWDGPVSSTHLGTAANTTRHGFTDHEHLDSVKLIHMGGRVYDPLIGRFLSRDPYIDGVDSSQGANGYGYVHNNPLSRWDPTGYSWMGMEEIIVDGKKGCGAGSTLCNVNLPPDWRPYFQNNFMFGPPPAPLGSAGGATTPPAEPKEAGTEEPQEPKPPCEGKPQLLDPALATLGASAATAARNSTGEIQATGSRGVNAVTSARIAPYQQLAANTDWAALAKFATRASWGLGIVNTGAGFIRGSVSDGMYALTDLALGVALPFVPWVGIPSAIAYGAHGGSKAVVNDVKYVAGRCERR